MTGELTLTGKVLPIGGLKEKLIAAYKAKIKTALIPKKNYEKELFKDKSKEHFQDNMFVGMEFDPTMIRIGAMNLILHGIENPKLVDVDALSKANSSFEEKATLILANPPFKGSLDREAVDEKILSIVDSKKTELLFLALMIKGLKLGGRCAVIAGSS